MKSSGGRGSDRVVTDDHQRHGRQHLLAARRIAQQVAEREGAAGMREPAGDRHQLLADQARLAAREHRQVRAQQPRGRGDGKVRLIVVGQREHADTVPRQQAGKAEVRRVAAVGGERRNLGTVVRELRFVDPQLVDVEHDEALAARVERVAEQPAGLAVARDQIIGFADART